MTQTPPADPYLKLDATDYAISYVRFSSAKQELGRSLERQLQGTRAAAAVLGLKLDEKSYVDFHISGFRSKNSEHGELGLIIQLAAKKAVPRFTKLFVESIDRISRADPYRAMGTIRALLDEDVIIVTTMGGIQIYSKDRLAQDSSCGFILQGMLQRAHEESKTKSRRVRDARSAQREAFRNGTAKTNGKHCPGWLRATPEGHIKIPDRVETVKMIFDLSIKERLGRHRIAQRLNEMGREPFSRAGQGIKDKRAAGGWTDVTVKLVLTNRAVQGWWQPYTRNAETGKREKCGIYERRYPQIISDADFNDAAASVAGRATHVNMIDRTPYTARIANLLSGSITCSKCGGRVSHHYSVGKRGENGKRLMIPFLSCDAARRAYTDAAGKRVCEGIGRHEYRPVETSVLNRVVPMLGNRLVTGSLEFEFKATIEAAKTELAAAREDARLIQTKIDRLLKLDAEDDNPTLARLIKEQKTVGKLAAQAETKLLAAQSEESRKKYSLDVVVDLIDKAEKDDPESRERLRDFLRQYVTAVADPDRVTVNFIGVPDVTVTRDRQPNRKRGPKPRLAAE